MYQDINQQIKEGRKAVETLLQTDENRINSLLESLAQSIVEKSYEIMHANKIDLDRMIPTNPKYDRLLLNEARIKGIADSLLTIARIPSPVGRIIDVFDRPNGLTIEKWAVPFGVIGVIFESRPNVSVDVFGLCLKSQNTCILKGGKEAQATNQKLVEIIHQTLRQYQMPTTCCTLLPATREATHELLHAEDAIDLIIPRGSKELIDYVRKEATVPVIETGAGICHLFFDKSGDIEKGRKIIENAKTRRVSVCNALDCLLVHQDRLDELHLLIEDLAKHNVTLYADGACYDYIREKYPLELLQRATEADYGTEYLDYKMSIHTVADLDEALGHIARYSSKHSEAIVAEDEHCIRKFLTLVDAACVYANASTSFTDGGEFGFGGEIGISTQKLHARGPMAVNELTTYKYIIRGSGQIRSS